MPAPAERRATRAALAALAGGLALFALAFLAARATLPEWRAGDLPSRAAVVERFRDLAAGAGVELDGSEIRAALTDSSHQAGSVSPYEVLGPEAAEWLLSVRRPVEIEVSSTGTTSGDGLPVAVTASLGLDGRPWELTLARSELVAMLTPVAQTSLPTREELLLGPGERLGAAIEGTLKGNRMHLYPVLGGDHPRAFPEFVAETSLEAGPAVTLGRGAGTVDAARLAGGGDFWARAATVVVANVLLVLGVTALAFALVLRRRIDFANAGLLSAFATAASVASLVAWGPGVMLEGIFSVLRIAFDALFLLLLWAVAESLLRDVGGEETDALDLLRRGRAGPRVGRAVLWGLGIGAAAAAAVLLSHAAVGTGGWLADLFRPEYATVTLPPFRPGRTPFDSGIRRAGEVLLVLAVAHRLLPRRWAVPGGVVAAALVQVSVWRDFVAVPADLVLALAFAALLAFAFDRAGSLATLVAAISAYILPAFAVSAQHPAWLGGSLAVSSIVLAGLGLLGFVGLARADEDLHPVAAPAFLARIEEERRVRYEVELLARIQLGLLPRSLPDLPGWQIAARSMVAHEVGGDFYDFLVDDDGRLWVAAGDVAGHGSFCSISHAMTKAALASLVAAERTPAGVLAEVDRVLRTVDAGRIFTSLALLRIDPQTGDALLANAGYPFPLVRSGAGAAVREIELPGLPLGQGPSRTYRDVAVGLAPGDSLVFASDGLFEARRRDGEAYGYGRYRADLADLPDGAADHLLQALLARWRKTVGDRPIEDDTTVVVLRREG